MARSVGVPPLRPRSLATSTQPISATRGGKADEQERGATTASTPSAQYALEWETVAARLARARSTVRSSELVDANGGQAPDFALGRDRPGGTTREPLSLWSSTL